MYNVWPDLDVLHHASTYHSNLVFDKWEWGNTELYSATFYTDTGSVAKVVNDVESIQRAGVIQPTFYNDFYFRTHRLPAELNLGNIVSDKSEDIVLWVAYPYPVQLSYFNDPQLDGVSISKPQAEPFQVPSLNMLTYELTATPDGASSLNLDLVWTIDGENVTVNVKGLRSILFPFYPDWKQPVVEVLEWLTDVITSNDGDEQRVEIRSKPRRKISYLLTLMGEDLGLLSNLLYAWQNKFYSVPVWQDSSPLLAQVQTGDTSLSVETVGRSFTNGGAAVLFESSSSYEQVEITNVSANSITIDPPLTEGWVKGTKLIPVNVAKLNSSLSIRLLSDDKGSAVVDWEMEPKKTDPYIPEISATEFLEGIEVSDGKFNWKGNPQLKSEWEYHSVDGQTSGVLNVASHKNNSFIFSTDWWLEGKQQMENFRGLLGRMKGQQRAIYIPSGLSDFKLTKAINEFDTSISVKYREFHSLVSVSDLKRAIYIKLYDGSVYTARIIGTQIGTNEEIIGLDLIFDRDISISEVKTISVLYLMRNYNDSVTIYHQLNSLATVRMNLKTVTA